MVYFLQIDPLRVGEIIFISEGRWLTLVFSSENFLYVQC